MNSNSRWKTTVEGGFCLQEPDKLFRYCSIIPLKRPLGAKLTAFLSAARQGRRLEEDLVEKTYSQASLGRPKEPNKPPCEFVISRYNVFD